MGRRAWLLKARCHPDSLRTKTIKSMQNSNQRLLLKARPDGIAGPEHFQEDVQPVRMPGPGELLLESVYISIDPAMRVWVSENPGYVPPVEIGTPMRAGGIGRVLVSEDPAFQPGDFVNARLGWQTHPTVRAADSQKLDLSVGSPKDWIGPLGTTALTASCECNDSKCEQAMRKSAMRLSASNSL